MHPIVYGVAARGESLLDFTLTNRQLIANVGTKPTFFTATREEVLDITLSSKKACYNIANWHVSEELRSIDRSDSTLSPPPHLPKLKGDKLG
ncbi:hypothetical protein JTB14_017267 [Gonioctena quinquepunctata]|nr:hypothetical protein JTB14_017267 [Gonioctena quinquepunctata]